MNRRTHWDRVYRGRPSHELSWFQEFPALSIELVERTGIGKGDAVIDVGGGDSRLVDVLIRSGFEDVTVLDVSTWALERTRQRLGEPTSSHIGWVAVDVTRWVPERVYGLWHDRAVFHFLTDTAERHRYIEVMRRALRSNANAVLATFSLEGPGTCSGLEVRRYSADMLASELRPWFRLVEFRESSHLTPTGAVQSFIYGRFRKTS